MVPVIVHREAPACRTTLVSASCATRYAATSTAAGSDGRCSGRSTSRSIPQPSASPCPSSVTAPKRPRSSISSWTQALDDPAHLEDGLAQTGPQPDEPAVDGQSRLHPVLHGVELERQSGQGRAEAVVQVGP